MPIKFFGQYLVDEGILDALQLRDAMDHAYFIHRSLGDLVVQRGLMSAETAREVHALQRDTDRFFGELCVERGLLRQEQLDDLLEHQRTQHTRVGEILLELGHLTPERLELALAAYRADQSCYEDGARQIPEALEGHPLERVLELFPRLALRSAGLHIRIGDARRFEAKDEQTRSVHVTTSAGRIGVTCEDRFAGALLGLARGSVEPEVDEADLRRALTSFVTRLALRVDPAPGATAEGSIPPEGTAFEFISTRGDGLLILAPDGD